MDNDLLAATRVQSRFSVGCMITSALIGGVWFLCVAIRAGALWK